MNWDVLLHWMTHLSEGSWDGFKEAVARMADREQDVHELQIDLRSHMSDMAYAEFFVDGLRRWRVFPPVLAELSADTGAAVLCGGRTPQLTSALVTAAEAAGCLVASDEAADAPTAIRVTGAPADMAHAATAGGIRFVKDYAGVLSRRVQPVYELLERAIEQSAPTNWSVRSFDFDSMSLVDGLHPNSACECSPRHGLPRWYVHTRRGRLRSMPKREAVYAAAMMQGVALLSYDFENRRLLAPVRAPPPEPYCRAACLCAGRRGRVDGGLIVFDDVSPAVVGVLCVAAGQPHPGLTRDRLAIETGCQHGQPVQGL
jgi:hypothetical protein